MGGPGSGQKTDSSSKSKRPRTESLSHPEYADGSSQSAKPKPEDLRTTLRHHNHYINDNQARQNHSEMLEDAMEVIDGKRGSAMGDEEQEMIINTIDQAAFVNEDTFIDLLWWKLLGNTRMVPKVEIPRGSLEDGQWMSRYWCRDHLRHNRNRLFRQSCLPLLRTDDEFIKELIESLPKLNEPKPDLVYGLEYLAFTEVEQEVNDRYPMFTNLSPGAYHPFLIVEFKTPDGNIEDAINQASRSASAVIHGLRGLDEQTPRKSIKRGVDTRTWLFSLALDTKFAALFVNWALLRADGATIYHMHRLASYRLDEGGDVAELKTHLDNVMDWGVSERKEKIQEMMGLIRNNKRKPRSGASS